MSGSRLVASGGLSSALASAHHFVGNAIGVATDVAMTGDVTQNNTGVTAIGAGKVTPTMLSFTPGLTFITSSSPSGTGVVTFSSITGTFSHLLLFATGRSTLGATPGVQMVMTFNNDTSGSYDQQQTQILNATNGASQGAALTGLQVGFVPWSTSTTNNIGYGRAEIFSYTTSLFKSCFMARGSIGATAVDGTFVASHGMGMWRSTASINRIDLTLGAGNWVTGSFVSLYGFA